MKCAKTGSELPKLQKILPVTVYAACRGEDKKHAIAFSAEAVTAISEGFRSSQKRTLTTGGWNLCKARVAGEDEFERLVFDPATDHLFSIDERVFQEYLSKTPHMQLVAVA